MTRDQMWEDRGHAGRISKAAKAAGYRRSVELNFRLRFFDAEERLVMSAIFSPSGAVHRSTVRTITMPQHAFAETWITPSECTRVLVAWFEAECPPVFSVTDVLTAGWLT